MRILDYQGAWFHRAGCLSALLLAALKLTQPLDPCWPFVAKWY